MKTGRIYIGTSGYSYNHWRKVFYPPELASSQYLEFYSKFFCTVEMNVTFYRTPPSHFFGGWNRKTPPRFGFSLKGSRYITHVKKLNIEPHSLDLLMERARLLHPKLEVVLWQLPPNFGVNPDRLETFLKLLEPYKKYSRFALEFRNPEWLREDIYGILKGHNIALCNSDWEDMPTNTPETADFIYVRRHGISCGGYSDQDLNGLANYLRSNLIAPRDAYVYFNNDLEGWAVKNAMTLLKLL